MEGSGRVAERKDWPRVAIVTGASSGIGEAVARRLVAEGCAVVGNARGADRLDALERELGPAFAGVAGDAADGAVQEALFATARARFGREADLVVVNAGRGLGGAVSAADLSRFEEVVRTNLVGATALLQRAAQRMLAGLAERPYPVHAADIVVLGSVAGRNVSPFSAVYGSTKFAIHAVAEGLRREIGPKGIRVTLIEPGIVLTGFQAVAEYTDAQVEGFRRNFGPLLAGEDVARAVSFVVSQPPHVHLAEIVVRPTRQDYP